jgi:site-specific DNA-methyltransferase (adenine-specific)
MKWFAPLKQVAPAPKGAAPTLTVREIINQILFGDCIEVMAKIPAHSVDFVLTDPPYITRYKSRDGKTVRNDNNDNWIKPAFAEIYRLMKPHTLCVSFYGWPMVETFAQAWKAAGFNIAGHIVFRKPHASSGRFLKCQHEQAYLLAKGNPDRPTLPIGDVIDWHSTGNNLIPLIWAFTNAADIVLDPFCGSGSTLAAAKLTNRNYVGIELDEQHHRTATFRLTGRQ